MNRIAASILGITALFWIVGAKAEAAGASVEENSSPGTFKVTLDNASVADVLHALHDKYGVEVQGLDDLTDTDPVSAEYSGKLPDILSRLLRNQNFSIVRSNSRPTGILKVFIATSKASVGKGASEATTPKSSGD
ncbi:MULTISPECIES: hypothetical protein [unclassified Hyphomicrobium]|uniref:hypothetical protein n=1 Tax=unclassified Hyphomicrobium TaxID=2619925 RepID=UPI000213D39E|nr:MULTISPECIES: hypothetical protein [unclassified Hyphomicrobium]CCB66235.1 exported protein of unknown function [Hyphomicrobium sp. MC1]